MQYDTLALYVALRREIMHRDRMIRCLVVIIALFLMLSIAGSSEKAVEEALTCSVHFDAKRGLASSYEKVVKVGTHYGELPNAERTAYMFLGWYQKNIKINPKTIVYLNQEHTLTAKWLGTPSLDYEQQDDFVRIRVTRLGDASGVCLYVNGKKYDSAKLKSRITEEGWSVTKSKGDYIFFVNMPEAERYRCYARAYYRGNGRVIQSDKSEVVAFDNRVNGYKTINEELNQKNLAISMENYYSTGKGGINRWESAGLTPQGICYTEEYILITGYGPKAAKIVVLDRKTKEGLLVLGLHEDLLEFDLGNEELLSHIGGIAYDNENHEFWVSGISKKTIIKIKKHTIDKYVKKATLDDNIFQLKQKKDFQIYKTAYENGDGEQVYATPSFLEFENGELYIGTFHKDNVGHLRKFKVCDENNLELLEEMQIPNKIQGAVFTENGELILSQSYGRNNNSRLYVYEGEANDLSSYRLRHIVKEIPPMSEELMLRRDCLYILFESSAKRYRKKCKNVQEDIWAVSIEEIVGIPERVEVVEELEIDMLE